MFNDCDKKILKKEFDVSDFVLEETEKIIRAVEKNKICKNEQPGKIVYAALYIAALQGYWRENTNWITQKEIQKKSGILPANLEKIYKEIATKLDIEVIIPYGSSKRKQVIVKPIVFDWKSVGIDPEEIRTAKDEECSALKQEVIKAEERLKAAYDFRRSTDIATEKGVFPEKYQTWFPSDFIKNARINLAKKDFKALKAGIFSATFLHNCSEIKIPLNRTKRTVKDYPEDDELKGITEKTLSLLLLRAKKEYITKEFNEAKGSRLALSFLTDDWQKEAIKKWVKEGIISWEELAEINKELVEKIKEK